VVACSRLARLTVWRTVRGGFDLRTAQRVMGFAPAIHVDGCCCIAVQKAQNCALTRALTNGRWPRKSEEADVVYVVEIESLGGERAIKEYDARSAYELNFVVKHELSSYPAFRVVDAWPKGERGRPVFISSAA
jgi:hypothetical protein